MAFSIDTVDKQVRVSPGAKLLNLNFSDTDSLLANPLATAGEDKAIHAVGILYNSDLPGMSFYIENTSDRVGWDVADCTELGDRPQQLPTGALHVPVNTTPYHLIVEVPAYRHRTSPDPDGVAEPGEYVCYKEANGRYQLAKDRESIRFWVKPEDNVLPPEPVEEPVISGDWVSPRESSDVPEPVASAPLPEVEPTISDLQEDVDRYWKESYKPYPEPKIYRLNLDGVFTIGNLDETGEQISVTLRPKTDINVYGTVMRDNQKWYRLRIQRDIDFRFWVCVPQTITLDSGQVAATLTVPPPSLMDRLFHRQQQLKSIFPTNLRGEKYIDSIQRPQWFAKPSKYRNKGEK